MAIYEYRCAEHEAFELLLPLGTAPADAPCPTCGASAHRVFSVSMVKTGSRGAVFDAIERADRSRHEPEVVSSIPAAGRMRQPNVARMTPALARLPRP